MVCPAEWPLQYLPTNKRSLFKLRMFDRREINTCHMHCKWSPSLWTPTTQVVLSLLRCLYTLKDLFECFLEVYILTE